MDVIEPKSYLVIAPKAKSYVANLVMLGSPFSDMFSIIYFTHLQCANDVRKIVGSSCITYNLVRCVNTVFFVSTAKAFQRPKSVVSVILE